MKNFPKFLLGILTGFNGVLIAKSYIKFQKELEIAKQRVKNQEKAIITSYGKIIYNIQGEGPPVLVIHGAGGGFDQALHTAQIFGKGFQWIAPSRFGYLGTPLPDDATPEAQADAYTALLDGLGINEPIPIIGISAGGPSSIQFAIRHPERCSGLVMVSGVSRSMIDVASNPEVMEAVAEFSLASEFLIWLGLQLTIHKIIPPFGVPKKVIKDINEEDMHWLQTLLAYILPVQSRRKGLVNDYLQVFKLRLFPGNQVSAPTLIIHAKDDSLVSIKQGRFTKELIPHAKFVELPSGGHLLLGQGKRVGSEIETFLWNCISGCQNVEELVVN